MIAKRGNKWVVFASDGETVLGRHDSREEALKQLEAIEIAKKSKRQGGHAPGMPPKGMGGSGMMG